MSYQIMPDLTPEEYEELKEDIRERGVMVPIEYDEGGNILDGFNRKKICDELGITDYPTVIRAGMTEEEKFTHARKLNLARRHLSQEQKRELVKQEIEQRPDQSDRQIAESLGVSPMTVADCRAQLKNKKQDQINEECPTVQSGQLDRTTGSDGRQRPASASEAEQQRSSIQDAINKHPEKTDRQIAKETGASPTTVGTQRKKMVSAFNPSSRDAKALKDPDIVRRIAETGSNVAGAIREQKRDQLAERLDSVEEQEAKAVEGVYDVIVVDPPWPVGEIKADVRASFVGREYPTMSVEDIGNIKIPAADNCHLFLWTTMKFLPDAFKVLEKWGAKYVCTFVWNKEHDGFLPFGLPRYNCEFCLYAHIGSPEFLDQKAFYCCFSAPTTGNSAKPEEFYEMIRRTTAGRRLDMFNRRKIEGFDGWGNESPK